MTLKGWDTWSCPEQGSRPRLCSEVAGASRGCTPTLTGASPWASAGASCNPGTREVPVAGHCTRLRSFLTQVQGVLVDAPKHSGEAWSLVQGHPALPLVKFKGPLVRR